jgi:LruC domain-containing protein
VHLKGNTKTTLGNNISDVGGGNNNDPDGDYLSSTGFPWAINIIHDFKVPKESISIRDAYNNFENWATSGGNSSTDWYKDTPGNRNDDKLQD